MQHSQFRMFSIGIVVKDKEDLSDEILVSPIETLSIQESGNIKEASRRFEGDKGTVDPNSFNTKHESKDYILANWRSTGNGNRTTAPDVIAGETVVLYKFSNVEEYFWDDLGREPSIRKLEDVLYSFSNVPTGKGTKSYDPDTSYWVRVSTKDKFVHIHTADNDGEPCTWDIKIDTGKGMANIIDGLGNFVEWNAVEGTHLTSFNNSITRQAPLIQDLSQTHIISTGQYIAEATVSHATKTTTCTVEAYNSYSLSTSYSFVDALNSHSLTTTDCSVSASSSYSISTSTYTNSASSSVTNDTPELTNTGNVTTLGNTGITGDTTILGAQTVTGIIKTLTDLSTPTVVSFNAHDHISSAPGAKTSIPTG